MVSAGTARRRGFGGPELIALLVIGLGVWFLLENLGLLPRGLIGNFWRALGRYWPILLVLAGLELLVRRRAGFGWLLAGVVIIAVIGAVSPAPPGPMGSPAGPRPVAAGPNVQTTTVPLPAGGTANVTVENPFGSLRILSQDTPGTLLTATGTLPAEAALNVVDRGGGRVSISTNFQRERRGPGFPSFPNWGGEGGGGFPHFGGDEDARVDVAISPQAPLDLRVASGAAQSDLDLSQLRVGNLTVESGVGETKLRLPAQGDVHAAVRTGAGAITIEVPAGIAARITTQSGIGSVSVDEAAFPKSGNVYQSPDWATATNRVDLKIEVGVGGITVRRAS